VDDDSVYLANQVAGGARASVAAPAGVSAESRTELHVRDPVQQGRDGWLYLFAGTALHGGDLGSAGVVYTFALEAGDYRTTYRMGSDALPPNDVSGPNPENSTAVGRTYELHFGDRWLNDGLVIRAGNSAGADVLERSRVQLTPETCGRSEDTFNGVIAPRGPKAFIANISGPVRGVRSYMGANSGNLTSATDFFYPDRVDTVGDLRVHTVPGVMTFEDLATGMAGMRYSDDLAPGGVPIDGVPDSLPAGTPRWQMVSGPQGSLVTVREVDTSIPGLVTGRWHLDDASPELSPCTGDAAAWGQHGVRIFGPLPCTDPRYYGIRTNCPVREGQPTVATLRFSRIRYFRPPGVSPAEAAGFATRALEAPLVTAT
jgi:hypothetical protein